MAQAWTRIPELRAAGKHFQRAGRVPSSSAASEGGREGGEGRGEGRERGSEEGGGRRARQGCEHGETGEEGLVNQLAVTFPKPDGMSRNSV